MSEWVSRKNAPAGNDSENSQKFFPFCVQIKNENVLYRTWKMQNNNNKWIAPASWKWNLDQRICDANKICMYRRRRKGKSAGRKYKNILKRD